MFVSLQIAMCQTFTGEKNRYSHQVKLRVKKQTMHTIGESEHFCTDTLRKLICSLHNFIPNLGILSIPFQFDGQLGI
jgi:hypothetical protein